MSPATQAAIIGGIAGGAVGGFFTLLGVVAGLFGERWVRSIGRVRCEVDSWIVWLGASRPDGGTTAEERRLQVSFLNQKDLDVTVWAMSIEFYKGGEPLEDWARPHLEFIDDRGQKTPLGPVNLPSRGPVTRTISVTPVDTNQKLRALEKVDRAVFVADIVGAGDKRKELSPPW